MNAAGMGMGQSNAPTDAPVVDTAEQVYISSLALLKMLKHGRAGKHRKAHPKIWSTRTLNPKHGPQKNPELPLADPSLIHPQGDLVDTQ